ncbi:MAG: hypothetical protein ACI9CO_000225 [Candidatus Azotimanducaceae bacterium]|jgi:hypothetical protein
MQLAETEIVFVHKRASEWLLLLGGKNIDEGLSSIRDGTDAWIVSTYRILKEYGLNVSLIDSFKKGCICICHYDDLSSSKYPFESFVIVIRADRSRSMLCDIEVVQSPASTDHKNSVYIPHWQQPGLIPRSGTRGNDVTTVGYFGLYRNLSAKYKTPQFTGFLKKLGVEFKVVDSHEQWSDYSQVDVVLAVRDGTPNFLASKPATKLFNAWLAGCPVLVGEEPAIRHYQQSHLDFIRVRDVDETVEAVRLLKNNPRCFLRMVERGFQRSREVDRSATALKWFAFFEDEVLFKYKAWEKRSTTHKRLHYELHRFIASIRNNMRGSLFVRGYDKHGIEIQPRKLRQVLQWLEKKIFIGFDK